jgi:predicted ATP-grasp superfamily ATP-dependent carboligase
MKYSIAILDGQSVQALIFAKSLSKLGHNVILFCDNKYSYGYNSRYAIKKIICPSTETNEESFNIFFFDYLDKHTVDVVIPMNDYSAKYLSKNKDLLKNKINFIIPDYKVFQRGYDKNKLMNLCREINIPHPNTIDLSKDFNLNSINYPALIKPNETSGARGFKVVYNTSEFKKSIKQIIDEFGDCHLQEYIPPGGKQFKVQLLRVQSKIIASTVIEKIRFYPISGGSSCFNKTINNIKLEKLCSKVLEKLDWIGFADFDLIEDPRTNEVLIMEINPRVPACIKVSVLSNINFPSLILDSSIGITEFKPQKYIPNKYLRFISLDILWIFSHKFKLIKIRQFLNHFGSKDHHYQELDMLDLKSFIVGSFGMVSKLFNRDFMNKKNI